MSEKNLIFLLSIGISIMLVLMIYQHFKYRTGIKRKLIEINLKLTEILDVDSSEKIMVFTDNKNLIDLSVQINRLLEERQKMKADFRRYENSSKKMLSNISHDIKTPLTVILGYLEIMRLKETENEMLERVERKAKQVMELINQFFTLAKLESGDMELEIRKVNVNEICRECILDFYHILPQTDFQVEIDIPEENYFVWGEKETIRRILINLISNAVRYGVEGQYLGLFLRYDDKNVLIDIVDKGKGIEKNHAAYVFDRLYTMEDSRNYKIQGNGLGLTIAKNLANALGGDIILISNPNVRTVFTVKLKPYPLK